MSLVVCAVCGHYGELPDELWLRVAPLNPGTLAQAVGETFCSPRCAVLWLEREHRPTGLGVAL